MFNNYYNITNVHVGTHYYSICYSYLLVIDEPISFRFLELKFANYYGRRFTCFYHTSRGIVSSFSHGPVRFRRTYLPDYCSSHCTNDGDCQCELKVTIIIIVTMLVFAYLKKNYEKNNY